VLTKALTLVWRVEGHSRVCRVSTKPSHSFGQQRVVLEGVGCRRRSSHSFGECRVVVGHRAEGGGSACGVLTKAFALIWRVAGSPLGTGSHGTTIDANTKNDTRRWNTCTPSLQFHPPSTVTRVGACNSTVPVCACRECSDEREVSGELKKEKTSSPCCTSVQP
jgi:hypothetical protein